MKFPWVVLQKTSRSIIINMKYNNCKVFSTHQFLQHYPFTKIFSFLLKQTKSNNTKHVSLFFGFINHNLLKILYSHTSAVPKKNQVHKIHEWLDLRRIRIPLKSQPLSWNFRSLLMLVSLVFYKKKIYYFLLWILTL